MLRRAVALAEECLWMIFSLSLETSLADISVALAGSAALVAVHVAVAG